MKRIIWLKMLAAAMALAALCSCSKKPVEAPIETTQTSVAESQTAEPLQTDANGVTLPYFRLSALPQIGEYEPPQEIFSRYYKEYTNKLIASDKYGELIPFRGKTLSYYYGDEMFFDSNEDSEAAPKPIYYIFNNPMYGLATLDGKIVVDPTYEGVWRTELDNGKYIYILNIIGENKRDVVTVAASDGSWVISGDYSACWYTAGGRIILKNNETADEIDDNYVDDGYFSVFDYNGNLVFTIDNVSTVSSFSDGYAAVSQYTYDENDEYHETSWYIDENGKKVLGDFDGYAADFNNGYASVADGDFQGYIDTNGKKYDEIPFDKKPYYSDTDYKKIICKENGLHAIGDGRNGENFVFFCVDSNKTTFIFNIDGDTLMKIPYRINGICAINDYCICVETISENDYDEFLIIDRETDEILKRIKNVETNDSSTNVYEYQVKNIFEIWQGMHDYDNKVTLYDCKEKKEICTFYNNESGVDIYCINDVVYLSKYDGDYSVLYDENDKVIMRINTNSTD